MDPHPWLAVPWLVGGIGIGLFGLKAVRPSAAPLLEWYRGLNPDPGLRRRIVESRSLWLMSQDKIDSEEFDRWIDSKEFKFCMAEEQFWVSVLLPPLFGLYHGVRVGATFGALCGLIDDEIGVSACTGAAWGLLVGPLLIAIVAGLTLACIVDVNRSTSLRARLARRALLVISPLLFVPAAFHSLKKVIHRGRSTGQIATAGRLSE